MTTNRCPTIDDTNQLWWVRDKWMIYFNFFLSFIDNHQRNQNRNGYQCLSIHVSWNVNQTYKTLHAQNVLTPTRVHALHTRSNTHTHTVASHIAFVCVCAFDVFWMCIFYWYQQNVRHSTESTNAVVGLVFERIFANFHNFKINEERNSTKKKKKRRRERERRKKKRTREELIVVSLIKLDWLCVCISFTSAR